MACVLRVVVLVCAGDRDVCKLDEIVGVTVCDLVLVEEAV